MATYMCRWGMGDVGVRRLFVALRSRKPFVMMHICGTVEMNTEISDRYMACCGNEHRKKSYIYICCAGP